MAAKQETNYKIAYRSPKTQAVYEREASDIERQLDHELPLAEAMVQHARRDVLRKNSQRRYRAPYRELVARSVAAGRLTFEEGSDALEKILAVLGEAREPPEPRTSRKKNVDFVACEHQAIVRELERREDGRGDALIARYTTLHTILGVLLACRPDELWALEILPAARVRLPNCKFGPSRSDGPYRVLDVSAVPPKAIGCMEEYIALVAQLKASGQCQAQVERSMAGRLARASEQVLGRVLCPTALRHIGIAIWREAGFDDETIRALLGHASVATARVWYSRLAKGWSWGAALVLVRPSALIPAIDLAARGALSGVKDETSINERGARPTSNAPPERKSRLPAQLRVPRPSKENSLSTTRRKGETFGLAAEAVEESFVCEPFLPDEEVPSSGFGGP